jgi:hypothetical protein
MHRIGRQGARPAGLSRARVAERITRWADVRCARESGRRADIGGCLKCANRDQTQRSITACLFDHLVGSYEQAGRDRQAKRLRRKTPSNGRTFTREFVMSAMAG